MKKMKELLEKLCYELDEIAEKNELGAGDLELAHKLTDTIKNIYKIDTLSDDGYSNSGGWFARGIYDDDSYRGRNRDRTGKYARSTAKDRLIERTEKLMDDATTEAEREAIRRCVNALRQV